MPLPDDDSIGILDRRGVLTGLALVASGCAGVSGTDTPETTPTTSGSTRTEGDHSTGTDSPVTTTPTATPGTEPVVLAGSLPLSGSLSAIGVPLHRGLRTWARQINARKGLRGRPVDLRIKDDRGQSETAREIYRSLVTEADLLVAPYGSPATKAVIEIVESAGVPCVAHTAGDRALWADDREWTVQLLNPIDTFLHSLLAAAAQQGTRSVALLYRDDAFTPTMMQGAVEWAREQGWRVTNQAIYTSTDGLVRKMAALTDTNPDLLIGGGFRPGTAGGGFLLDALALSRAYAQVDSGASLVNWGIGASFPAFRERRGREADGETGVTGWKAYVGYPGNEGFVSRYADRWGTPPDAHAAQGYAAGQLFARAVERANTIDSAAVRDALFALRTATVFGRYRVNDRGLQVGKDNAVVQWQEGSPVVVWPERWRNGDLISAG